MPHLMAGDNVALIACRQQARSDDEWAQAFATFQIAESCAISNITREINYIFPLYLYPGLGKADRSLFSRWTRARTAARRIWSRGSSISWSPPTELRFLSDGRGNLRETLGPEDILAWIYAVFHSPEYRARHEAQLKLDFPRVPLPGGTNLFGN